MKIKNIIVFIIVVALLAVMMVWTYNKGGFLKMQRDALQKLPDRPDFSFTEVFISEISGQNKYWEIKAAHSIIDKNKAKLEDLSGIIYSKNKKTLKFTSPKADADLNKGNFRIQQIKAQTYLPKDDPWYLKTDLLLWNRNKDLLQGKKNVEIKRKKLIFTSDSFIGISGLENFSLKDSVRGLISRSEIGKDKLGQATDNVVITSEAMNYYGQEDRITATDNVVLTNPSFIAKGNSLIYENRTEDFALRDKVRIVYFRAKTREKADMQADTAAYNSAAEELHATGNVRFRYKDIICEADSAIFYKGSEYLELLGDVKALEGQRKFIGKKVGVYLEPKKIVTEGRSKFISPK